MERETIEIRSVLVLKGPVRFCGEKPVAWQATVRKDAILARLDESSQNHGFRVVLVIDKPLLVSHVPKVHRETEEQHEQRERANEEELRGR